MKFVPATIERHRREECTIVWPAKAQNMARFDEWSGVERGGGGGGQGRGTVGWVERSGVEPNRVVNDKVSECERSERASV